MKITFRHSRYISFIVTMLACAASIVMMVKFFDYPVSAVMMYLFVCVTLLLLLIVVSACLAFIFRFIQDLLKKREHARSPSELDEEKTDSHA